MRPLIVLAVLTLAPTAHAHELDAYLTPDGVRFVEGQLASYVPGTLTPPPMSKSLASCPGGGEIVAEQYDTVVDLDVYDVSLAMPRAGIVRLELSFDVAASGLLDVDNAYACFGVATCTDELSIAGARAIAELEPIVGGDGVPRVELVSFDLGVDPDEVAFQLDDCGISGIVNLVVDFGKSWLVDYLTDEIREMARTRLAPAINEFVAGLGDYQGTVGIADVSARVTSFDVGPSGMRAAADVDLSTIFPAGTCVADLDPGDPGSQSGSAPDLRGADADAGVAVNLGLLDDGVYHIWRDGLMCVTGDHLNALGLDVDLELVTGLLGLPGGGDPSLALRMNTPPRVVASDGAGAAVDVILDDVVAELETTDAEGERLTLRIETDIVASGAVVLDPGANALALRFDGAAVDSLRIDSSRDFDTGRIHQVVTEILVPALQQQMARVPLTGPVLNVADYYLIPRELGTDPGFVHASVDFFRAPADDHNAPETRIVSAPTGVVSPHDAIIRAGGEDAEVPPELLRYRFRVAGQASPPSYLREVSFGQPGVTDTYDIQVVALDLAGNQDATPARATVTVDGVAPSVSLAVPHRARTAEPFASLRWSATDDLAETEDLTTRIEVLRLSDPTDSLSGELVDTIEVASGETGADVDLPGEGTYRLEVQATDQAGNTGRSTQILTYGTPGACSAGTGTPAPTLLLVLIATFLALRRRDD